MFNCMSVLRRIRIRGWAGLGLVGLLVLPSELMADGGSPGPAPAAYEKWTSPPSGEEPPAIKGIIDQAASALESGRADGTAILTDAAYMDAHAWPRFRELIRKHAQSSATIVTPTEPGVKMTVSLLVVDGAGKPAVGATVYVYQTNAAGLYAATAGHIRAEAGDSRHARLFGYLKTGDDGRVTLRTIRPAGYPDGDMPEHIHVEIEPVEGSPRVTEIVFHDDPRLTPRAREAAVRDGFAVGHVERRPDGSQMVSTEIRLR